MEMIASDLKQGLSPTLKESEIPWDGQKTVTGYRHRHDYLFVFAVLALAALQGLHEMGLHTNTLPSGESQYFSKKPLCMAAVGMVDFASKCPRDKPGKVRVG
jgi:hypothetical protein